MNAPLLLAFLPPATAPSDLPNRLVPEPRPGAPALAGAEAALT